MIIQISDFCQPQTTEEKHLNIHNSCQQISALKQCTFVCPHSAVIGSNLTWDSQFNMQFYLKSYRLDYMILRLRYK